MHLDAEQVERLLAGALEPGQEAEARAHLRGCPHCERRLDAATREEAEAIALLRRLDHPAPAVTVGTIIARASVRRLRGLRVAAAVLLALAMAGALYAFPGSPLPGLLRGAAGHVPRSPTPGPRTVPPAPTPPAPPAAAPAGVAVKPGADFAIVFAAPQEHGVVRVRIVDAPEAAVRALGRGPSFEVGVDRVTVANAGASVDYEILLPRAAPSVRVRVGGATVLRKQQARVTAAVPPDAEGVYTLPLGAGR